MTEEAGVVEDWPFAGEAAQWLYGMTTAPETPVRIAYRSEARVVESLETSALKGTLEKEQQSECGESMPRQRGQETGREVTLSASSGGQQVRREGEGSGW